MLEHPRVYALDLSIIQPSQLIERGCTGHMLELMIL